MPSEKRPDKPRSRRGFLLEKNRCIYVGLNSVWCRPQLVQAQDDTNVLIPGLLRKRLQECDEVRKALANSAPAWH